MARRGVARLGEARQGKAGKNQGASMTREMEHRRALWRLRQTVRGAVRATWLEILRRRDERVIASRLRARDWDGYAAAEMAYWRRWER